MEIRFNQKQNDHTGVFAILYIADILWTPGHAGRHRWSMLCATIQSGT